MQYFKPETPYFAGDCMPFFHEGVFHLFYLLDENHHQGKGGLGGHQWAHASTENLKDWTHHPLAIPCSEDWEGSICTGSVLYHHGEYLAFYATRMLDYTQHLSLAVSRDGISFVKTQPNPFASPGPGYGRFDFRDPFAFVDEQQGEVNLLVTAKLKDYPLEGYGGCLARLTSKDLKHWQAADPFLVPGYASVPECSDYFYWNGWYYLIFSHELVAHYRMSERPDGPWLRPPVDVLEGEMARTMKTAPFGDGRRVGAAFIGTRQGDRDQGAVQWAGNVLLRELIQEENGRLGVKFPVEMIPAVGQPLTLEATPLTSLASANPRRIELGLSDTTEAAALSPILGNVRITGRVMPVENAHYFGLRLRGSGRFKDGYNLVFLPGDGQARLNSQVIRGVEGLSAGFALDILLKDDIIDVCIDERRCLIDRCPQLKGESLFFFSQCGSVVFDSIEIRPLV